MRKDISNRATDVDGCPRVGCKLSDGFSERLEEMREFVCDVVISERPREMKTKEVVVLLENEEWMKMVRLEAAKLVAQYGCLYEDEAKVEIAALSVGKDWWDGGGWMSLVWPSDGSSASGGFETRKANRRRRVLDSIKLNERIAAKAAEEEARKEGA